jgi:hypothetical protein
MIVLLTVAGVVSLFAMTNLPGRQQDDTRAQSLIRGLLWIVAVVGMIAFCFGIIHGITHLFG